MAVTNNEYGLKAERRIHDIETRKPASWIVTPQDDENALECCRASALHGVIISTGRLLCRDSIFSKPVMVAQIYFVAHDENEAAKFRYALQDETAAGKAFLCLLEPDIKARMNRIYC
ncbi:hypothetical protein E4U17_001247 [Claviceps sp. LM77 group G4]|nr:hypothetical protein E4U17_001247 [Claviceps sp. LM77 group G4]KAG6046360.1 hypothetical protein E4U33_001213 [Claviceps sp. LM78 group G4]